tara:strand:+ start:217 stop:435 length:219 start_codon:yes stop_codon:yes gene_type:complete
MSHLTTPVSVIIMIFYSLLTFFVGPFLTRPFMNDHPDQCIAGFLVGFTMSILLWMKYGRHYTIDGKIGRTMK